MKQYNTQEEAVRECGPNEITVQIDNVWANMTWAEFSLWQLHIKIHKESESVSKKCCVW